jgi:hypothetical protein
MRTSYSYFFANLPLFTVVSAILILGRRRPLCRLALYSGLACLPCCLVALMHRQYWRPARLGGWPIGVEDLIFTFTTGAAAWLCAAWPYRRSLTVAALKAHRSRDRQGAIGRVVPSHLPASRAARRILLWEGLSAVLLAALWLAGVDFMSATLLASIPLLAILLIRRRQLWILAGTGLAIFVPAYFAVVKLQFSIFPDYPLQWNQQGPWAAAFLGVPAGELAWAAAFALVWPVVIASAFEVEFRPPGVAASGL